MASAVIVHRSPLDIVNEDLSFKCLDLTVTAGLPSLLLVHEFLPHENNNAVIDNNINSVTDFVFIIF